jgi:hypothetical protein
MKWDQFLTNKNQTKEMAIKKWNKNDKFKIVHFGPSH